MATNVNLYNEILEIIKKNLSYSQTYLDIENDIQICDERSFEGWFQNGLLKPTTIYIIVSFDEGTIWFGNMVVPLTFVVYSELGTFENARNLLTYFATNYNFIREDSDSANIIQSYSIPTMQEEFVEEDNSFRAIFNMSGTFVYGENTSGITKLELEIGSDTYENINFLNVNVSFTMSPSSANIGNKNNRISTINKNGAFTMAFSIPSLANLQIVNKVDGIALGDSDINTLFNFRITKGGTTYTKTLHLISYELDQEITNMPMLTIGLGE